MPVKEVAIDGQIVRIKGRVKAITVPKDKTQEILKRTELTILDKKYEALLPPLDDMEHNTIDVQGLASLVQQYLRFAFQEATNWYQPSPLSKMVIYTNSGTVIQLNFANSISNNSQGMLVLNQTFTSNNLMNIQYYFVGFDTTDNTYQGSSLELYVTATFGDPYTLNSFTNIVRIAYASLSINKPSDSNLFIVWLIEYQNIPYYLLPFIPLFASNPGIYVTAVSFTTYVSNGSCNLACKGNCPAYSPYGFLVTVQNNTVLVQIPATVPVGGGVSSAQALICGGVTVAIGTITPTTKEIYTSYYAGYALNVSATYNFNSSYSTAMALSPSGGSFYVFFTTVAVTYQVS
jgi:hypothetical protein